MGGWPRRGATSRARSRCTSRRCKYAELAHDLRAVGLAHFELARCYKLVGDRATVADHFSEAATALHAVGDKRNLALVHSLSGSGLAQQGRYDEALMAMRQAERLAQAVQADDVVAIACGNQANVAMIRHRYEQALTLAERAVALHQQYPPGHGLAVALGTLGQIAIRLGQLSRAAEALNAALAVRTPLLYHETTGAIFDSLAQIHLIRGDYDACADALAQARDAFGVYDAHTPRWYDWSLRLIDARLTSRRGDFARAVTLADAIAASPGVPPADQVHAYLIAADALVQAGRARRGPAASRPHRRPRGSAHDARRLGRVPPRARRRGLRDGPRHRGLSRPVAERDGVRPARRTLSVGAQPAGARPRRGARRRAIACRADAGSGRRDLPRAGRGPRHARRRGGARVARPARHGRVRRRTRRCRRRGRAAHRRRGGAARACSRARPAAALLEIAAADAVVVLVRDGRDEPRVVAHAGCDLPFARDAGARRRATASSSATSAWWSSRSDAKGRPPRLAAIALVAAARLPGRAALAHGGRRGAPGIRVVRGARAPHARGRRRGD